MLAELTHSLKRVAFPAALRCLYPTIPVLILRRVVQECLVASTVKIMVPVTMEIPSMKEIIMVVIPDPVMIPMITPVDTTMADMQRHLWS